MTRKKGGERGALSPRKKPVQARSRATYDRILTVASRILVDEGYDALTMNRVVREAEVSPGTLYQYFPNRGAITVEVFARALDEFLLEFFARYLALVGAPLETVVRSIVEWALDRVDEQSDLWRAAFSEIPRRELLERLAHITERGTDLSRLHLAVQQDRPSGNDEAAVWVAISAADGILSHYLLDPPTAPREAIVDELVRVVSALAGDTAGETAS